MIASNSSYVCDTLPAARIADHVSRSPSPFPSLSSSALAQDDGQPGWTSTAQPVVSADREGNMTSNQQQHPSRKLCVRHQRMADEGTNLRLQQSLDALPVEDRSEVNTIWSNFSSSSHSRRELILRGILTMCCFSQLSLLTEQLAHLIRIDPFIIFPREVSLKVLGYLDAQSLCRAAQVNRGWKTLADDDILWRAICEQHIGQKCHKCGWGLPVLERRRTACIPSNSPSPDRSITPSSITKRKREDHLDSHSPKRSRPSLVPPVNSLTHQQASESVDDSSAPPTSEIDSSGPPSPSSSANSQWPQPMVNSHSTAVTRPWKTVYSERLTVERNWRRGRCSVRTLKGHTDGIMCLQFNETLPHPSFPVLITGSYDRSIRVWNLESGAEIRCLKGHTRAVRALQFDEVKLVTGSMDHTLRIWNWRTGKCIRTLEGHAEGVVCLNFDSNMLASGSVDHTVKIWNFRNAECFTLRGHKDWVNAVVLWDSSSAIPASTTSFSAPLNQIPGPSGAATRTQSNVDVGKMLFSASDDGTIRLWDLSLRTCVRQFVGHMGQVQSMKLLVVDVTGSWTDSSLDKRKKKMPGNLSVLEDAGGGGPEGPDIISANGVSRRPVLVSGSLDNTVKLWDIDTGKTFRTLFGHIEGVWAIASNKMRLVSGSHDRTIKLWNLEEGRCMATLVGHMGAVTCLSLSEDKIVSGSDDGSIKIWSFVD